MKNKKCARCGESKFLNEFCLTYKGEASSRCERCCKDISAEIQVNVELLRTYFPSHTGKARRLNDFDRAKEFQKEKKDRKRMKMKTYDDYVDEDVAKGKYSKADGEYYKSLKRNALVKGAGMFHGRISK